MRRRVSGESSSSAEDGRSDVLGAATYNLYLPPGNCSPASTGSFGDSGQDSPASEDAGSPTKLPRTEATYATLTPAAVANGAAFEMGSPVPAAAVGSPMMEATQPQPMLSNGCYTYDSLMQDDFPDLFVMHDGGEKRAGAAPEVGKGDGDGASFELVTPEMLREFRRRQAEAELQFDSAQDEADHGVVARPVLTEEADSRELPWAKGVKRDCENNPDMAKAAEESAPSPMERKSLGGSWMIPFAMGMAAALVAQMLISTLL